MVTNHFKDALPPSKILSPSILGLVVDHPQDGQQLSPGWLPTILGWSHIILSIITHHPQDEIWHLKLIHIVKVTTAINGHPPSQVCSRSPSFQRMVTRLRLDISSKAPAPIFQPILQLILLFKNPMKKTCIAPSCCLQPCCSFSASSFYIDVKILKI